MTKVQKKTSSTKSRKTGGVRKKTTTATKKKRTVKKKRQGKKTGVRAAKAAAAPAPEVLESVATKIDEADGFSDGIFESVVESVEVVSTEPPESETPESEAFDEVSTETAEPNESSSSKRAEEGSKGRGRGRGKKMRKSRTRRLAEEAEVIAAITQPEPEPAKGTRGRAAKPQKSRAKTRAKGKPEAAPAASARTRGARDSDQREMLINVAESEECRIAILRDQRLDELYIERTASSSNVGNIYKGRVTNVEPSIQAAFIDFGRPSHGFLHISDLHPQFFPDSKGEPEQVGKKMPRRQRPPIQSCLKRGQEVIVQVIKEGIGTKGPTLSSYVSLPGRFLVMMPGMEQLGVSRKIEDEDKRKKMRGILEELSLPKAMGFIVRTAGVDRPKRDLQRDLNFLARLWKQVEKRINKEPAPAELYRESDLVIRTIRDVYDTSLTRIVVDSPVVAQRVREFLAIASPRSQDVVEVYEGSKPIFHRYGIEQEIDQLHSKTVPLNCGGSLVIEQTEALVAIDVNSGRFRVPENAEETAYRVNIEAVDEIARQLRLRDLGGLIVCDLIDMLQDRHRRAVERRLSEALRKHKERAKILRISRFGLLEMTRQRQRPSLTKSMFRDCPRCAGSGRVKAPESVALEVMRQIRLAGHREGVSRIDVQVSTPVANDLLNRKRHHLTDIERESGQVIQIHGVESFAVDQVELSCSDRRGREVHPVTEKTESSPSRGRGRGRRPKRDNSKKA